MDLVDGCLCHAFFVDALALWNYMPYHQEGNEKLEVDHSFYCDPHNHRIAFVLYRYKPRTYIGVMIKTTRMLFEEAFGCYDLFNII